MEVPRAKAAYKKKDGIITLTTDRASLIWSPGNGTGPPVVSLAVANITNLQKTPDSSAKVMLKVFEKPRTAEGDPLPYLFQFTSSDDPRAEANAIKDILSSILAETRGGDPSLPKPKQGDANGAAGASASMSMASTANAKPPAVRWFDDDVLKKDYELQQSLLKKDASLNQMYTDARSTKPESISDATFNAQFWSTRVGLLRAHAIELNQKKGTYNVLSTIKPRTDNGELKLNLVKEQVQMIFHQHPLVKRIYNENVPKLNESDFWSRFFLSRLSKKLKGERVSENESADPLFDKYSEADNTVGFNSRIMASQVPHIIDLEANEENQGGFKSGNRKDVEMRPRANVPIVKTLNSLSEKIMADVAPTDTDPSAADAADGLDDNVYNELALRDLQADAENAGIALSVREQNRFLQSHQTKAQSEEEFFYAKQVPADVLFDVQGDMETLDDDGTGGIDLHKGIGVDPDSDSEQETGAVKKPAHVGSRAARKLADDQIFEGLARKRAEIYGLDSDDLSPMSIPPEIAQRCFITNATTAEFLKQFWGAFMSGDPSRMQELAYHFDSLKRSAERITALAEEAEMVRIALDNKRKQEIKEHFRATKKKLRYVPRGGGKNAVMALFEPSLAGLRSAQAVYESAAARR
ncbi:hypothetical protein B0H66DRAFT_564723 [Apodospora peruviana]|uniref:BSD domain-containing protein n=1 Tax=Apodospora peruviana TaxID=516989 RepID=A0AAE0M0Z1_9PEZI|nr:hypothetical protein B0H66DRAFT_564723 [Apodospora peruviana]